MIHSLMIGFTAAASICLFQWLHHTFANFNWTSPVFILGISGVAVLIQKFLLERKIGHRSYDGLADVFIHIHSPASMDSPFFWFIRGLLSFLLALFGGAVGIEGAAVEFAHAFAIQFRSRSARWFEQRRRTDASAALSAGIAAGFGTPFASLLLPIELGMGGKSISVAVSALVSYLSVRAFANLAGFQWLDLTGVLYGAHFFGVSEVIAYATIAVACGAMGALTIRFFRFTQDSLIDLFQRQGWMRILAGGVLLFFIAVIYKGSHFSAPAILDHLLWARRSGSEVIFLFLIQCLALAAVLAGFGTLGVFWPILGLGALFGSLINQFFFNEISGFGAVAVLTGCVGFVGAVFGAPVTGAVLIFELTRDLNILGITLIVGMISKEVRKRLKTGAIMERDLKVRGLSLVEGRSESILDAVFVRDAMVADYETAHEQEPVASLYTRLLRSRYPFLPVVSTQGIYVGLLTADMVQEAWNSQLIHGENKSEKDHSLARLLEAKDLLYRSGFKPPQVRGSDRLSATVGIFEDIPCVPVLGEDRRVIGLLFVHNVRLAYERELGRRSLSTSSKAIE